MSPPPNDAAIAAALAGLRLPDGRPLSGSDRLGGIDVRPGRVTLAINASADEYSAFEPLRRAAEVALGALPGIDRAFVTLTSDRSPGPASVQAERPGPAALSGVARILAVGSGKGGVGKSTTACNLALALRADGLRVGLLDADVYGPSAPRLFGLSAPPRLREGRILEPLDGYGVKVMSIGLLVDPETAMIWRGPMVLAAITQMLREVAWAPLDVLVVDLPPGTGDAALAIAQAAPLSGAVVVSTPQDLSLIDARRGMAMFARLDVPVLGLVENMASFVCTTCGTEHAIFGTGGARAEAERLGVPFLGAVPLTVAVRQASDSGRPVAAIDPDGALAAPFRSMARQLAAALGLRAARDPLASRGAAAV